MFFLVDGGYGDWFPVSECSVTVGVGVILMNRSCDDPPPSNGGADCPPAITQIYRVCQPSVTQGQEIE